ncbi:PREDICTED: UBP1-associated proteins 1C-like [Camelina sativa]|uniref:UBP1-associated proteins 1C-like n=1 Tax=Camelina sativa TaxID=90675 RepID=A0ABM0WA32_CAMSA|nr:PREDICTED: UBP1-associated proteins 1C-like [Camelina sativa]
MVWFQCEDCGESLKKARLPGHFSMCSATKLSCLDCGNMFAQDSVHFHNQCITEAEKYASKGIYNFGNSKRNHLGFDINGELYESPSWFCSLCDANMTCEQDYFAHVCGKRHREKEKEVAEQPTDDKDNLKQQPDLDIYVGLSNHYPWFCSLCNINATSQQTLLSHANGKKHQAKVKRFDAEQQQRQSKQHSTMDKKDNSNQQIEVDINVGLSNRPPWVCRLCNTKAFSQQTLLSHANGKKHRANVEWFLAEQQQQQLKTPTVDKKDTIENASNGDFEQNKVYLPVSSGVTNGYSQADKKRKLETFDETENREVVQAEEAKGGGEEKSERKKAKKQDSERKGNQETKSDSDFEYDKEDIKQLLVSYSKEELVNLVYKTAEKGSRLFSAIIESAERDIAQRNIFVRGFGWDTTHENLKAAFESYGEIEECTVIMDKDTGRCKGYGFVLFKTRKGAREALRNPEKRLYNRIVVCNLASKKPSGAGKVQDMVEPVKIDLTQMANQPVKIDLTQMANQSEVTFPGRELPHRYALENMHQQQAMYRQNIPFYGHCQLADFDPMYGALPGNQMVAAGQPNYCMFGSGMMMNQGSMLPPPNHMGMGGQYFGDGEHAWHQR